MRPECKEGRKAPVWRFDPPPVGVRTIHRGECFKRTI